MLIHQHLATQNVAHGPAAPTAWTSLGSLLEMQNLRPTCSLRSHHLHFDKISMGFACTVGLENYRLGEYLTYLVFIPVGCPPLIAQLVKNPPAMQETPVWSLGWKDPLEKGKATHSSILAWKIPWTVQSMGSKRVRHNWATFTFTFRVSSTPSSFLECV